LVVGDKEKQAGTVNVRTRDNKIHGEVTVEVLMEKLKKISSEFITDEDTF
jgi:threonyl-tRNA synthetase